jgi:bacterial leucyl aminopeptidase
MAHASMASRVGRGVAAALCVGCLLGSSGQQPEPVTHWSGLTASGTIARNAEQHWRTPRLSAGSYQFELSGTGDADLYVRIGSAPTPTTYDCGAIRSSNKSCFVHLAQPAVIHVMVLGYAPWTTFKLVGRARRINQ